MPFANTFDNTFPPDTQLANLLGDDIRKFKVDIQQRMAALSGLDAAKPAFGADSQPASWNGILFFATDTGKIYQFNNPAWTDVTAQFRLAGGVARYYDGSTVTQTNASGTLNSITIPGGTLVGNDTSPLGNVVKIDALIAATSTAGGITVSLKFGATTLINCTLPSASVHFVQIQAIVILKSGNVQRAMVTVTIQNLSGTAVVPLVQAAGISPSENIANPLTIQSVATGSGSSSISGQALTVEVI
jgi:hypothetical protein